MVLNLTAMIDVVFLLIMFFVLVAKFGRYQTLPMELPKVDERRGELQDPGTRPTVDVVPRSRMDAMGAKYRFGAVSFDDSPEGLAALTGALLALKAEQPELEIFVRAERVEPFARVQPAVQAVGAAGIKRVHLVTLPKPGRGVGEGM